MLVGILVVLGLIVASGSLVSVMNGGLLAISGDSAANKAQAVAESGADQIIAVLNQPENRKLLVSGDVAPTTTNWTTSNESLRSPCVSISNKRPGINEDGYPSSQAVAFADGNFRNLSNISQSGTGDRRFALKAVRYSTGINGDTNRRGIYRTYNIGSSTAKATAGTVPSGNTFTDLVNLSDPDGSSSQLPGTNTGLIAITVEGRVYRNGSQVGSATVTKEYEVIPKCCGGSFGSNGSGGKNVSTNSLGSDSRYCGVDFGMIAGINGGKFWSYYSNDKYTQRNADNQVVSLNNILGIVSANGDPFGRANATISQRNVGCRVIPGPCSTTSNVYVSGKTDPTLYGAIPNTTNADFTSLTDIAGTSASGVAIVPLFLSTGLPTVASRYGMFLSTSSSTPPANRIWASRPAARIGASNYPSFTSIATSKLVLRTRNDTSTPRVEFCDATYTRECLTTSTVNSWAEVSTAGTLRIGDDFGSDSYSGRTGNVNRWVSDWKETEPTTTTSTDIAADPTPTSGSVAITGTERTLRLTGGSNAPRSIERVINLHALQSPSLQFKYTSSSLTGTKPLIVEYSTDNGATYYELASLPATTTSGTTQRFELIAPTATQPNAPTPQTGYTRIRFRLGDTFASTEWVGIDDVEIVKSDGDILRYDDWCQYSSTFPTTSQFTGGFHCLGPSLSFSQGGTFIVDTSGGSLSWHYNDPSDTRGSGVNLPTLPVIFMANGATLQHVNCSSVGIPPTGPVTPSDNCPTPIPDNVYSVVGEQDMFNIFGRDTSPGGTGSTSMQWIQIGSFANKDNAPGKIAGAWFYMPYGAIYLIADQCGGTGGTVNFDDPDGWNFGGRLWMRYIIPCGTNYFRVPPSSSSNLDGLLGLSSSVGILTGDVTFVSWNSFDWVARAPVSSRLNSSL
jgi:hypothetical protein